MVVKERTKELEESYEKLKVANRQALFGLAEAIEAKDPYTKGHCGRVAAYSLVLAKEAGYPADGLETLEFGAFLHDIGKIGIRDAVLLKPGPLDEAEWVHMREHPVKGYEIAIEDRDAPADHAGGAQPPRALGRLGLSRQDGRRGHPAGRRASSRSPTRSTRWRPIARTSRRCRSTSARRCCARPPARCTTPSLIEVFCGRHLGALYRDDYDDLDVEDGPQAVSSSD